MPPSGEGAIPADFTDKVRNSGTRESIELSHLRKPVFPIINAARPERLQANTRKALTLTGAHPRRVSDTAKNAPDELMEVPAMFFP
jgi:hypothetical protein